MRPSRLLISCLLGTACHPPWDSGDSAVPDTDPHHGETGETGDTALPGSAPEVAFTSPDDGAGLWEGAPVTFALAVSDPDDDIEHVEASSDLQGGLGWAYDLGDHWAFDASLMAGEHSIAAVAFDEVGHSGMDAIAVNSRACTEYADRIPCRFTFDGEESPLSVADNANSSWDCEAGVRDAEGGPAEADLGDGRFGVGVVLDGDGTSLETWLPDAAGAPPWTVQLWFRGDTTCDSWDGDYPLLSLVSRAGGQVDSIVFSTLAVEVAAAGSTHSESGEPLFLAWEDQSWHLFSLSASAGGDLAAYLDGSAVPFFALELDSVPDFSDGILRVGASPDAQTTWCGGLDDVSFTNLDFTGLDFAWTQEAVSPFCLGEPL